MAMKQQKVDGTFQFGTPGGMSGVGLGGTTGIGSLGQLQQTQGGLQLGGLTATGLGGLTTQNAGLQVSQHGGGVLLGQQPQMSQLGALRLPQYSQAGGLQLGKSTGSLGSGLQMGQLGGVQTSGLQMGQLGGVQTSGLQMGQLGGVQTSGLQMGQLGGVQTSGLQMGQQTAGLQSGQLGPAGGLKLGPTSQTGLGIQSGTLQLGQGGLTAPQQAGQTMPAANGLQLGRTAQLSTGLQLSTSQGLSLPQSLTAQTASALPVTTAVLPGLQAAKSTAPQLGGLPGSSAGGGLKLASGLPAPTQTTALPGSGLKLGGLTSTVGVTTAMPTLGGLSTLGPKSQPAATSTQAGGMRLGGGLLQAGATTVPGVTTTTLPGGGTSIKGLGGVDPSTLTGKGSKSGPTSVMDTELPDVLNQLVGSYEQFIKTQKEKSDLISKFSDSGLKKVKQDTTLQEQALATVSSHIMKDSQVVGFLKNETSEELMHAEVAQRTQELPAGLQHENTAPDLYFHKLVSSFETKMVLYRREIEELESHLSAIATDTGMSPQNIIDILQLQYKPFLLLAAQLQTTHEHVQNLKEQYLSYRRVVLQDPTDIFEERKKAVKKDKSTDQVPTGPSPFSSTVGQMTSGLTAYPTAGPTGLTTGLGSMGGGLRTSTGLNQYGGTGVGGLNLGIGTSGSTGFVGSGLGGLKLGTSLGGGLSTIGQPTLSSLGGVGGVGATPLTMSAAAGGSQPFTLQRPPLGKRRNG